MKIFQDLFSICENFEKHFPVALFWNSYLSMIQTPRDFAKSVKIGDWDLYMFASEKILHRFHAYDHFSYTHCFS